MLIALTWANKKNGGYHFTRPSFEISTKTHLLEFSTVTHIVKIQINILKERPRDISRPGAES